MMCPYCRGDCTIQNAQLVYPHIKLMHTNYVLVCSNWPACDAYVGCHKGTKTPLGTPARGYLRKRRGDAHAAFDPLWRKAKAARFPDARNTGYRWLAHKLDIHIDDCHIGMFNEEMCEKVIALCENYS